LMNDAVYKFKRYEDSSLSYTGIDRHRDEAVGGWDTVLTREEYEKLFGSQQVSMSEVVQAFDELLDDVLAYADTDEEDTDDEGEAATDGRRVVKLPVKSTDSSYANKMETVMKPPISKVAESIPKQQYNAVDPKEKRPQMDLSGVKPGVAVKHNAFGDGVVVKMTDGKITVAFGDAEKVFQFPMAFENGFLRVEWIAYESI